MKTGGTYREKVGRGSFLSIMCSNILLVNSTGSNSFGKKEMIAIPLHPSRIINIDNYI